MTNPPRTTLWRPTGPKGLALVHTLNWRTWPPVLAEQPIFRPLLDEDYAIRIAQDRNVRHDGAGFVTRFEVGSQFLARYPVRRTGGETIRERCVTTEGLDKFNARAVGRAEVVREFR